MLKNPWGLSTAIKERTINETYIPFLKKEKEYLGRSYRTDRYFSLKNYV